MTRVDPPKLSQSYERNAETEFFIGEIAVRWFGAESFADWLRITIIYKWLNEFEKASSFHGYGFSVELGSHIYPYISLTGPSKRLTYMMRISKKFAGGLALLTKGSLF